jgi:penicillin-insensitive murein endopeptidase
MLHRLASVLMLALVAVCAVISAHAAPVDDKAPAKVLFGAVKEPAPLKAKAIGSYARGCLAGGVALPVDGPNWQAMRLSRNRNWGHPDLVRLVERLATEARQYDGWPGLLVGDLSQPRGGPMLSGHASHQIGLDADIWLTPMPDRRLSRQEREDKVALNMVKNRKEIDPSAWSDAQARLIRRAATYPQVERIFVHPPIKRALCKFADREGGDTAWLAKVRPYYGHTFHFHIRMRCPAGSDDCRDQPPARPKDGTGCGEELAYWYSDKPWGKPRPPGTPPPKPAKPPKPMTLAQLPGECRAVLSIE